MTAAAATGQTWLGTSRFSITLLFAALLGTVRRREWLGSAANGRIAAVAAMAVQSSWLRINVVSYVDRGVGYASMLSAMWQKLCRNSAAVNCQAPKARASILPSASSSNCNVVHLRAYLPRPALTKQA